MWSLKIFFQKQSLVRGDPPSPRFGESPDFLLDFFFEIFPNKKKEKSVLQVRLDAVFTTSSSARSAFKAIHDKLRSRTAPSLTACCLVEEEDLGYNLPPVLTELQLLRLQSSKVSMNVFLTFLPIETGWAGIHVSRNSQEQACIIVFGAWDAKNLIKSCKIA